MTNKKDISSFLISKGFELIQHESSQFFGDYYTIYCNNYFQLKISSSKSYESLDIRSNKSDENWFDLALVKALLHNESNLNCVTTINEYWIFLENGYTSILELFSDTNYPITKKKLEKLENERVKQMFSKWL